MPLSKNQQKLLRNNIYKVRAELQSVDTLLDLYEKRPNDILQETLIRYFASISDLLGESVDICTDKEGDFPCTR